MKKRGDMFFGLHFDFHASPDDTVAAVFDPDAFARTLDRVKPDFIQCDTKGHPGISSYPTKVGTPAARILHDVPRMLRELTRERGIALFAHYSGVLDSQAAKDHPDWAIVGEDGEVSEDYMSVFSPYADEILIPQLKELRDEYGFDGAWVDGECWASFVDRGPYALAAYREKTKKEPPAPGDADYEEYREFCRQGFRDYVAHYVKETAAPGFEATSNWLFSAYMPEAVTVPVPFLSGDLSPDGSPYSAREGGRYFAGRGLPWDLMSWASAGVRGFEGVETMKEPGQLCQEAALVVALGGGFQLYAAQGGRGGTVQTWAVPRWEAVARFARKREALHGSRPCSDIGVLVPDVRTDGGTPALFKVLNVSVSSWLAALCESGFSPDTVFEADAKIPERIKLLVVPNAPSYKAETVRILKDFSARGGKLIVDFDAVKYFADPVPRSEDDAFFVWDGEGFAGQTARTQTVEGDSVLSAYDNDFKFGKPFPACVRDGNTALFCFDFSASFDAGTSPVLRRALRSVVSSLGLTPEATVDGDPYAELSVTEKDGDTFVTVVNVAGDHKVRSTRAYDRVPPLLGVTVTLKCGGPREFEIIPAGETAASARYEDGAMKITFDKIDISATVRIPQKTAEGCVNEDTGNSTTTV